jgi:hypothetical protein
LYPPRDYEILDLVDDLHKGGVPDPDWIASMSPDQEWKIITRDPAIRSSELERRAWKNAGHVIFFLEGAWLHAPYIELSWKIVRWWPYIVDAGKRASLASSFSVPYRGHVGPLLPTTGKIIFPIQIS